jgi:predicted phage terminase large subunit-like protein
MSAKEHADYTCFLVGGVTDIGKLYILQMVHGRFEYPELKRTAINLYNIWQRKDKTSASAIYLENKASGIQLIQDFQTTALPVIPIDVTKDKLARVEEVLEYIASGQVLLPESELYGDNPKILAECEAFTRDLSQSHDDIVDTLVHLINNTIANRQVSILEVL